MPCRRLHWPESGSRAETANANPVRISYGNAAVTEAQCRASPESPSASEHPTPPPFPSICGSHRPPSLLWAFHYGQGALTPPGLQRTLSSRPQPGAVPAPLLPLLSSAGSALICSSIIYSGEPTMAFWHAYLKCALSSPPATVDNKMCHTCEGSVVCVVF
jgi:hypothetical protein